MLKINISEVNNGYIVNIEKTESTQPSIHGGGLDFTHLMKEGMKAAMKVQNEDDVLAGIHEQNNKQSEAYLGTSVFAKFEDAHAFIKLAKEELSK